MELRITNGRKYENLQVIRDVLAECEDEGFVLLDHDLGGDFLIWCQDSNGKSHYIFSAIPSSWLVDPTKRKELQATTMRFVEALVDSGVAKSRVWADNAALEDSQTLDYSESR